MPEESSTTSNNTVQQTLVYGNEDGNAALYFKWTADANGNQSLVPTDTEQSANLIYRYNPNSVPIDYKQTKIEIILGDNPDNLNILYYKWAQDENGNTILSSVENSSEADITIGITGKDYGTGSTTAYYKWVDGQFGKELERVTTADDGYDIAVKFDDTNLADTIFQNTDVDANIANTTISVNSDRIQITDNVSGTTTTESVSSIIRNTSSQDLSIKSDITGNTVTNTGLYSPFIQNIRTSDTAPETVSIKSIIANVVDNNANYERYGIFYGGIIANFNNTNSGTVSIGTISGNFVNNSITKVGNTGVLRGSLITNEAQYGYEEAVGFEAARIDSVDGNFIGNKVIDYVDNNAGQCDAVWGVVLSNYFGHVGSISGNFVNNAVISDNTIIEGGVIFNTGLIDRITGNFQGNYMSGSHVHGGVISNGWSTATYYNKVSSTPPTIKHISGTFVGNYITTEASIWDGNNLAYGGVISNTNGGIIGDTTQDENDIAISGSFINNYVKARGGASGGAIFNTGAIIGNINADFIGNHAQSTTNDSRGGAIRQTGAEAVIETLNSNFVNNYSISDSNNAGGGAIANSDGTIENITGNFINNYSQGNGTSGGAIYQEGAGAEITTIDGDFIGNYAQGAGGSGGGAIWNSQAAKITTINGDFIGNYTQATTGASRGGAVLNFSTVADVEAVIETLNSNFINNYSISDSSVARGGAISNTSSSGHAKLNLIKGDFINNYVKSNSGTTSGGAIFNSVISSTATDITEFNNIEGNFLSNYSVSDTSNARGGAIANVTSKGSSLINNITGDFINNYSQGKTKAQGGAIYNESSGGSGKITMIDGDFIENHVSSNTAQAEGGAIYNYGNGAEVTNIDGDFINNYASSNSGTAGGGAIFNYGSGVKISSIDGDFIGNYTNSDTNAAQGGAIHNYGSGTEISTINGDFTGNYASSNTNAAQGGAIYNYGNGAEITTLDGDFTGNYVIANSLYASGGAIYNASNSVIKNITGNFIGNYALANGNNATAYGGAIMNRGDIGELTNKLFIDNYAKSTIASAYGGAIYTGASMKFTADNGETVFSGNYTDSSGTIEQNAIYVENSAAEITLKAINNGKVTFDDTINGKQGYKLTMTGDTSGLIVLNNRVDNATATFNSTNLKVGVTDSNKNTSDIFQTSSLTVNSGVVDTADRNYTNYNVKRLTSSSDARYSIDLSLTTEEQLADTFTVGSGSSGTIYISSVNVSNTAGDNEKYILQIIKAQDDSIQLDYDNSKVVQWATAVMTSDTILAKDFGLYTTNTKNDSLVIRGLQDSFAEWAELDTNEDKIFTFVDGAGKTLTRDITELAGSNITIVGNNNTIDMDNHKFLDVITDGQNVSISDVTIENSNDIINDGTLTLDSVTLDDADVNSNKELNISGNSKLTGDITNNGELNLTDTPKIEGILTNNQDVNISDAAVDFNNKITGEGNIKISDSTVNLNNSVSNQTFTVENSDVTLDNAGTFINNSLYMNDGSFNIPNLGMSNLAFDTLSISGGNINIGSVDVDLANETMGTITSNSYNDLSGTVNVNHLNLISSTDKLSTDILFTDKELAGIVSYNGAKEAYTSIYKYDINYNAKNDGGYFNFSRSAQGRNVGDFNPAVMASPVGAQVGGFLTQAETLQQGFYHMDRYTKYTSAQRLAAERNNHYAITESGTYSRSQLSETSKGIWFKPYTSFETVNLKGGIGVSNVTYGTLIGGDTDLYNLGHGYKGILSTFIGYNGSHQTYSRNSIYQNGGTLGITGTVYKNNFFTGITASTGAITGSADTMYGTDNFTMLTAGIASKSGYNLEFKEGKFIVQPSLYLGYTFVNTFDYTNAAGVKIKSDPLHALQVIPGVTFIGNLKNGLQPYASVNMVFNAMDKTHFTANDARLPQLSVKPYIQYGVGVQKTWGEKFTGFLQTMFRNGGRNGIALSFGFRFALGKETIKTEKVKKSNIKQRKK